MKRLLFFSVYLLLICAITIGITACGEKSEVSTTDTSPSAPEEAMSTSQDAASSIADSSAATSETEPAATETTISDVSGDSTVQPGDAEQSMASADSAAPADNASSAGQNSNEEMLALAKTSGCLACHSVEKKIVGPAWKDVAARYKDDPEARGRLIEKVKKGGSGNWKEIVGSAAMPPYFPRVSGENIGKLVDFVLSLK